MSDESKIFGCSLRGWIALLMVLTVCMMQSCGIKVEEPLYGLTYMAVGYFFGQKTTGGANAKTNP